MATKQTYPRNPTFECLVVPDRRELFRALSTWRSPMPEQTLASYTAAKIQETASPDPAVIKTLNTKLRHVHLPRLEAAGFITWNQDEGIIETTAHPAFTDPRFDRLLETEIAGLNGVFSALSHDYRRIVLTALEAERGPMSQTELGQVIRQQAAEPIGSAIPELAEITTVLHHAHLPKLDELSFIEYDPKTESATYVSNPVVEDVFTVIYGREGSGVEKFNGFLDGLADSYRDVCRGTNHQVEWPHGWRNPHNG